MSVCEYCKHRGEGFLPGEDSPNCWSEYHACFEPEEEDGSEDDE